MISNKLYIKGMVCPRCISAVEAELNKLNIGFTTVKLGEVMLSAGINTELVEKFSYAISTQGFELLSNKKAQLVMRIKNAIINIVHHQNDPEKIGKLSELLPELFGQNYTSLSSLFKDVEGKTLEKYFILQKIEKAKELLVYQELNISEIAHQLNYSSSQHLSLQFKNVTGMSPSEFTKSTKISRRSLSDI